jgi:ribosome-associated protein YbcJ (S4-like RNA binding protein)
MVVSGMVYSNGKPETRKRYKVRKGDVISVGGQVIQIA